MFNSYYGGDTSVRTNNNIKINAVNGTLVKNYKDSFIIRFHAQSDLAKKILQKEPKMLHHQECEKNYFGRYENKEIHKPIVVLQVMVIGDMELLAEVMWKEDFDNMFEIIEEQSDD